VLALPLLALGAANFAAPDATGYPVRPVWDAFVSFCGENNNARGWVVFDPEPKTSLAYLAEDPDWRFTGKEGTPATVYRKNVAGRVLFGFRRSFANETAKTRFVQCRVYDFDATERLDVEAWSHVTGKPSQVRETQFHQRIDFDRDANPDHREGMVELRQKGMMPDPDDVGFSGLNLVATSKESL